MYGICEDCEYFVEAGEGDVSCDRGHEIIPDRKECEDYCETYDETGMGLWSMD